VTAVWVTPAVLHPFTRATVHVTVENVGGVSETAARVKVFIEDVQLGSNVPVALEPGETATVEFGWRPQAVGFYKVDGRVEPTEHPDVDRSNNLLRIGSHVLGRDVAVTKIEAYPRLPIAGAPTWLHVYVKNLGSGYDPNVRVRAYIDGVQIGDTAHVGLAVGERTRSTFRWVPPGVGFVSFEGRAEPTDFPDYNRANNMKRKGLHVVGRDVEVYGFFTIPGPPHAGEEARLGVLVYNNSMNREPQARVKLYVRGVEIGERTISIEPYHWRTVAIPYVFPEAGSYFVEGRIEPTNHPDIDRSNNYCRGYVTVIH
jgi:hypothetical protein